MTTAAWPTVINNPIYGGFTEQRQRNAVSFNPDFGQPKMYRRGTAATYNCQATFIMDDNELLAFITFYETTLTDGTLPFTWNHPRTGISYTWCFDPSESPIIETSDYGVSTVRAKIIRLP